MKQVMAKTVFTARLSDADRARLARLKSAEPQMSEGEIVSDALYKYELSRAPLAQQMLLRVYHAAGDAAQPLQYLEEERTLAAEEQEVLDFLNRVWDEARTLKLFTEPSLPPEAWEK